MQLEPLFSCRNCFALCHNELHRQPTVAEGATKSIIQYVPLQTAVSMEATYQAACETYTDDVTMDRLALGTLVIACCLLLSRQQTPIQLTKGDFLTGRAAR